MSEEFVQRMIETYPQVHTTRYWNEVEAAVKVSEDSQLLDIGCGPGLHLRELDRRYSPRKLIGVDSNPLMLEAAKEILEGVLERTELVLRHLQEHPELPSGNDVVFSSRVLRSFEDQYGTFRMIWDSLKPGGSLVLLDWARADLQEYAAWFKERWGWDDPLRVIQMHRNFSRYSIRDWEYILNKTGFKVVRTASLDVVHNVVVARK